MLKTIIKNLICIEKESMFGRSENILESVFQYKSTVSNISFSYNFSLTISQIAKTNQKPMRASFSIFMMK